MSARPPRPWTPSEERIGTLAVRAMSAVNTLVFRASGGRLGSRFLRGAPVLLLTTTGRKSGEQRTTPLIYLEDRAGIVLVASKGGMSHSPGWYHNLMAHPECEAPILDTADYIGSTNALLNYVVNDNAQKFIVVTEAGILHEMKKRAPGKQLIAAPPDANCHCNECPFMRLNTPEKVYAALDTLSPRLEMDEALRLAAQKLSCPTKFIKRL